MTCLSKGVGEFSYVTVGKACIGRNLAIPVKITNTLTLCRSKSTVRIIF